MALYAILAMLMTGHIQRLNKVRRHDLFNTTESIDSWRQSLYCLYDKVLTHVMEYLQLCWGLSPSSQTLVYQVVTVSFGQLCLYACSQSKKHANAMQGPKGGWNDSRVPYDDFPQKKRSLPKSLHS